MALIKTDAEREELDLSKARNAQLVINAYHVVFGGKNEFGNLIREDLRRRFGLDMPAHLPVIKAPGNESTGAIMGYDPIHAAIRDGQRSVDLHIQAMLSAPITGDGNITKPKRKVRRS